MDVVVDNMKTVVNNTEIDDMIEAVHSKLQLFFLYLIIETIPTTIILTAITFIITIFSTIYYF